MKTTIIDLGMHPYADTFIAKTQLALSEPVYPLQCELDDETGHVMLKFETNSDDRYNLYDYSYTSANSQFSRDHWDSYAEDTLDKVEESTGMVEKVLEIGSNDGYLSKKYQEQGLEVLGVDPSKYMAKVALEQGIRTHCDIFNDCTSSVIEKIHGKFDMVVANNVFNHANDPIDFAKGVKNILRPDGVFIFEVPYWYNTIVDMRFDQIYHEHTSYFTVKSSVELLKKAGLTVFDVEVIDYHGGSIRVYARIDDTIALSKIGNISSVNALIEKETEAGLFDVETYKTFMKDIKKFRAIFLETLYALSKAGKPIVGIGAAAKGNTFLNFYNLDNTVLDYITDVSQHKIGKYTPLTRIQILDDKTVFDKYDEVYAVILSWNISDLLKEKLQKISKAKINFLTI